MNVGFIGLGKMGMGMSFNILKAGFPLVVHDIRKETAEPLLKSGASWGDTPKSVAMKSDVIFSSLPGPKEVEAITLGDNGVIEAIRPGAIFIDLSTDSPSLIRRLYRIFKEKGAHVLDAPVGSDQKARK
jgi:3-hydroxyisobutyrate dehydrogenase